MPNIILVYANCRDTTAKGDFSFAGNIARDLTTEIKQQNLDMEVVLVSTLDGVSRFEQLYGNAINGKISVDNESIRFSSLEQFDAVENNVIAFIEANRCKHASADIIKRILSPDSKFLFIGNANQIDLSILDQLKCIQNFSKEQPALYENFSSTNLIFGNAGLGNARLGLPSIKKSEELPALDTSQEALLPKTSYGFMYLLYHEPRDYKLIAQYIKLSNLNHYVLIGNFETKKNDIKLAYNNDHTFINSKQIFPQITYHQFLPNIVMRKVEKNSADSLILSTGVLSALEGMQDGKLVYYQDSSTNTDFVAAYLIAIKSIISSDTSLFGHLPQMIIELSNLLFADKPLKTQDMQRTHDLLAISSVKIRLIEANQKVIEKANGKLASNLLSFIGTNGAQNPAQLSYVCTSLRKPGETTSPKRDQALRRAAAWGRLFELKVLIKSMSTNELDLKDSNLQRTALHWAAEHKQVDCLRILIQAGASLDIQDKEGKTALHKAVHNNDKPCIQVLVEAGASLEIPDNNLQTPKDVANTSLIAFMESCQLPTNQLLL